MGNQKLCECGCGAPTPVIKWSDKNRGWVKGQHRRFLRGHSGRLVQPTLIAILENTKESETGCLEWQGCTYKKGYGRVHVGGRDWLAHRWVYTLAHGDIPEGLVIRHTCDNPKCVNPDHLISGTHAENASDMVERGRSSKGSKHGRSVLTEAQVVDIRSSKETSKNLALLYGVAASVVSDVRQGHTWKHVQKAGS